MQQSNLTILAKSKKKYSILCKKRSKFAFRRLRSNERTKNSQNIVFMKKKLSLSVGCKKKNPGKRILIQFLFLAVGPH